MSSHKTFSFKKPSKIHLVDQVTNGGRLARVDMANDDDVDVNLFLSHPAGCETRYDLTLLKEWEVHIPDRLLGKAAF